MNVLDRIIELKNQGIEDEEIINQLRQEKISPREIENALNQAQIKRAVSKEDYEFDEMEPSIMSQENLEIPVPKPIEKSYSPKTREIEENYEPSDRFSKSNQQQKSSVKTAQYSQQVSAPEYSKMQYKQQPQTQESFSDYSQDQSYDVKYSDTDAMIEVSEQVFDEKISEILNQLDSINKFKVISETKLENFETRLRKIESMIDNLQISILEKVGSYGENLSFIKKEMEMMQDSFGKVINPLVEKSQAKSEIKSVERYHKDFYDPEEANTSNISSDISSIIKAKKPKKFISKR